MPSRPKVTPDIEHEPRRWHFSKVGLAYKVAAPEIETEIVVSHLKRSSDGMTGEIRVITNLEGIKTGKNGVMHAARFNLTSSQTRSSLAKLLESRTPGRAMDWFDGLEMLCQDVLEAETVGQPYIELGDNPTTRVGPRYALDPIVPANVTTLLYGPGGSGKSVLALACALSVKTGHELIPGVAPAMHGNVLYLDWETDGPVINERVQAICAGAAIVAPRIVYRRCIRPLAAEAEEIANAVAERDISYMVIDSAGMAMGAAGEHGDANESTLRLFDAIRHIGVTTQVIDHVSKQEMRTGNGKVVGRLPYGSIYKVNLARSAWEIRNSANEEGDDSPVVSLIHTKANDSRLHDMIDIEIDWQPESIVFRKAEVTLEPYVPDSRPMLDRVIDWLAKHPGATPSEIAEGAGVPLGTVKPYLSVRHARFFIRDGDRYSLNEEEVEKRSPYYARD